MSLPAQLALLKLVLLPLLICTKTFLPAYMLQVLRGEEECQWSKTINGEKRQLVTNEPVEFEK